MKWFSQTIRQTKQYFTKFEMEAYFFTVFKNRFHLHRTAMKTRLTQDVLLKKKIINDDDYFYSNSTPSHVMHSSHYIHAKYY